MVYFAGNKYYRITRLVGDIDEKDTPFVALTLELEGELRAKDDNLKKISTQR
jgi:predicted nucleic acid-binding protein